MENIKTKIFQKIFPTQNAALAGKMSQLAQIAFENRKTLRGEFSDLNAQNFEQFLQKIKITRPLLSATNFAQIFDVAKTRRDARLRAKLASLSLWHFLRAPLFLRKNAVGGEIGNLNSNFPAPNLPAKKSRENKNSKNEKSEIENQKRRAIAQSLAQQNLAVMQMAAAAQQNQNAQIAAAKAKKKGGGFASAGAKTGFWSLILGGGVLPFFAETATDEAPQNLPAALENVQNGIVFLKSILENFC